MGLRNFVRERNRAVAKGDIDSYKAFLKKACEEGAIKKDVYEKFCEASELTQQATIEKLACEITTLSVTRRKRAALWLVEHDMYPGVRYNK